MWPLSPRVAVALHARILFAAVLPRAMRVARARPPGDYLARHPSFLRVSIMPASLRDSVHEVTRKAELSSPFCHGDGPPCSLSDESHDARCCSRKQASTAAVGLQRLVDRLQTRQSLVYQQQRLGLLQETQLACSLNSPTRCPRARKPDEFRVSPRQRCDRSSPYLPMRPCLAVPTGREILYAPDTQSSSL
jgi:hypothetical protein